MLRLAACLALFHALGGPAAALADETRPNIVVILVDDMGFSDLGCYGGEIETPHIDQLASNGLRFTQFHNAGRCCPTRASLLTGLHPHQAGIGHMTAPPHQPLGIEGPYQGFLNRECVTLAEMLRPAGYHTLMTGKWHVGGNHRDRWPLQRGFDRYFGGLSGAFNYFRPDGDRGLTLDNQPFDSPDDFYATDAFTDRAIEFVTEAVAEDDRPFFLYLAYNAPHWPLNAKWEHFQRYRGRYRDGWEALMRRRLAKQQELGLFPKGVRPAPHVGPKWESLDDKRRDNLDAIMAAYAGCIHSIDENIGKLRSALVELDAWDNTLLVFLSDNGACQEGGVLGKGSEQMVANPPPGTAGVRLGLAWANACNTPFRLYKHFVHEGGACTPFIVHWPHGIPAADRGGFVRPHAYLPDLTPTFVELAGTRYPPQAPDCPGRSLAATIRGQREPIHTERIYWEHEGNAAVRDGDWKLVRQYKKPWELYDMASDPTEMNDLAAQRPQLRNELATAWESWARKHGVSFPERFNMYEFLKKRRGRRTPAKGEAPPEATPSR